MIYEQPQRIRAACDASARAAAAGEAPTWRRRRKIRTAGWTGPPEISSARQFTGARNARVSQVAIQGVEASLPAM